MSRIFNATVNVYGTTGQITNHQSARYLGNTDAFVNLYYSEIDRFGSFVKFPIRKAWKGGLLVSKIYNPRWLLRFYGDEMSVLHSDNDELYKETNMSFFAPFVCGLEQCKRNYWQVTTKFDDVCPSLTLLTDPTGVKEFWKLRDIPEGRKRRDALLHWVDDHWRRNRKDPEIETYVRKHMRGAEELRQGQFYAKITPSDMDELTLQIAKEDRERMAKLKTDRRVRVKRLREKLKS
jgi:hypothetical protein